MLYFGNATLVASIYFKTTKSPNLKLCYNYTKLKGLIMKKLLSLLLAGTALFAMTAKQQNTPTVTINGKIGVYGNEPHTFVAIKNSNSNTLYRIENAKGYNLDKLQNKTVTIKAIKIKDKVGPGFPAVIKVVELVNSNK